MVENHGCVAVLRRALMRRSALTALAAMGTFSLGAGTVFAQQADDTGLAEIVVTAQKREQSLQDVPIAITAITADSLQTNRITSVGDLSGISPGLTTRASAGGSGIAVLSMRGITSIGVVPGADKQISIYLDGVYISSTRSSLFELPDIARIEVLRGPQGTLFGRNATAGAVSIVTRDPTGTMGARQDFSLGNYGQVRIRSTVDLPSWGPLSAYVTYVHDKRRGDIRNLGAGTTWDRSGPNTNVGGQVSPRTLGDRNLDSWFAAVKFEPSDTFHATYKFDRAVNHFTPEGEALITVNPAYPGLGALITGLIALQPANGPNGPVVLTPDGKRPKAVNNSFATPGIQRNTGHSLTSELVLSDSLSLKNVAAYRKSYIYSGSQISGAGGLVVPAALAATLAGLGPSLNGGIPITCTPSPACIVGQPLTLYDTNAQSKSEQWSVEQQANYNSELLTLTVGGIWFHSKDRAGGPRGMRNSFLLMPIPNGRFPLGGEGTALNRATSLAAYAQAEVHVTPQIDLVGGIRYTHDKKSGTFISGGTYVPSAPGDFTNGSFTGQVISDFKVSKGKATYSLGVNYQPTNDILVYAKYSTGFVSGGSLGGVPWDAETVKSAEIGAKTDLFDRKLRANVALWYAKYEGQQQGQSGQNVGRPDLSTVLFNGSDTKAKGIELELTAAPVRGLTFSGSLGYTDADLSNVSPVLLAASAVRPFQTATANYGGSFYTKWTSNLWAQYETEPLVANGRLFGRVDATYRSRTFIDPNRDLATLLPSFAPLASSPPQWLVNTRVGLRDMTLGPAEVELAFWTRNLTNVKSVSYPLNFGFIGSASFQQARTYGADLMFRF